MLSPESNYDPELALGLKANLDLSLEISNIRNIHAPWENPELLRWYLLLFGPILLMTIWYQILGSIQIPYIEYYIVWLCLVLPTIKKDMGLSRSSTSYFPEI